MARRQAGRWYVLRGGYHDDRRWLTLLWGGDGEHPLDGAEWGTWREAWDGLHSELAAHVEHGTELSSAFLRDVWRRCRCGFDPRDNRALAEHYASYGFREVDEQGQIVRYPLVVTPR